MNDAMMNETLANIVKQYHPAAGVFEKYNLDYCCKGKRSLGIACQEAGVSPDTIEEELNRLRQAGVKDDEGAVSDNPERLISHIILKHHFYVRQQAPAIKEHLIRVATKHGDRYPYMHRVFELFLMVDEELRAHMQKEEMVLFPRIREVYYASLQGLDFSFPEHYISAPVAQMEAEHTAAGDVLYEIRQLTSNYTPPAGACTTFCLVLAELRAFEEDLHQHVHLENNVLFPAAMGVNGQVV